MSWLVPAFLSVSALWADTYGREMMSAREQDRWLAIGRLNIQGVGFCTATAVAQDMILTAAHCVIDKRTGTPVAPERLHFLPGFRAGSYVAHGKAHKVALLPGYDRTTRMLGRDIALIQLQTPLTTEVTPIGISTTLVSGGDVSVLSYGLDRAQIPSIERKCQVRSQIGGVVNTTCDGVPGVSGAPVIQMVEGQPRIVAVASAVIPTAKAPMVHGKILAVAAGGQRLSSLQSQLDSIELVMLHSLRDES